MKIRKNIILITIILVHLLMTLTTFAKEPDDIKYTFTQTDSTYSFSGSFKIKANPNCLLDICFQHEHISALAPDAKEVLIKDQGNDWNQISYTYQKFIYFENKSVWNRKFDKENMRVDFTLISSKNNHAIMPKMVSSSGYYQISMKDEEITVKYSQQCQLTKSSITNLYLNRVKKEALQFMYRFLKYANTICNDSLLNN
ncbi:MAG: hypothetical protein JEY96_06090 [Bacteroidales bacterium]|nr:hypothetical protein [Bacteroidales bacterium]